YVIDLAATWNQQAPATVPHYMNFYLPNGRHYSHAIEIADPLTGIRPTLPAMLYDYELGYGGVSHGNTIQVAVSYGRPARRPTAKNIISAPITIQWPLLRPV